jgi:hypothetical protein
MLEEAQKPASRGLAHGNQNGRGLLSLRELAFQAHYTPVPDSLRTGYTA